MWEAFTAFFIVSSIWAVWFWGIVAFALVCAFAENEKNFWAFVTVGAFIGLMQYSNIISIFAHPLNLLMYLTAYYVIGAGWSVIKWFSFIHKRADVFKEVKLYFIEHIYNKAEGVEKLAVDVKTQIPKEAIKQFNKRLKEDYCGEYRSQFSYSYDDHDTSTKWVIPQAKNFKSKIVTWILWWPTSMFWTILNDPLVRLANWVYDRFQGIYAKIANRAFRSFGVE